MEPTKISIIRGVFFAVGINSPFFFFFSFAYERKWRLNVTLYQMVIHHLFLVELNNSSLIFVIMGVGRKEQYCSDHINRRFGSFSRKLSFLLAYYIFTFTVWCACAYIKLWFVESMKKNEPSWVELLTTWYRLLTYEFND